MLTECLAETDHKDEAAALFEEYINNHDDKDITALSYLGDIYIQKWKTMRKHCSIYIRQNLLAEMMFG